MAKVMVKMGWTGLDDADRRHSPKYFEEQAAKGNPYRGKALGTEFDTATKWSGYFSETGKKIFEAMWKILNFESAGLDPELNGYTECYMLEESQMKRAIAILHSVFPTEQYGKRNKKDGDVKIYFQLLTKK